MNIQLGKWGNSLGVRIPAALAKEIGLHEGSELDLQQISGTLVLSPVVAADVKYSLDEMLSQITPESLHIETEWGAPVRSEHW
jgi:antitoxin MazE